MRSLIKSHKDSSLGPRPRLGDTDSVSPPPSPGRKLKNPIKSFLKHRMSNTSVGPSGQDKFRTKPTNLSLYNSTHAEFNDVLKSPTIFGTKTHDWSANGSPQSLLHGFERPEPDSDPETDRVAKSKLNDVYKKSSSASLEESTKPIGLEIDGSKESLESVEDFSIVVIKRKQDQDSDTSSSSSHFSFEAQGRNASLKYYKSYDQLKYEEMRAQLKDNQDEFKEFINDNESLHDLQEDMNYYDGDEEDDTEDLFNRKMFSSDDEDEYQDFDVDEKADRPLTVHGEYHFQSDQETTDTISPPLVAADPPSSDIQELVTRFRSNSIKYHQLQSRDDDDELDFLNHRYSWYANDETAKEQPFSSMLDEVNEIPEDYEFDEEQESQLASLSTTTQAYLRKQRRKQLKSNITSYPSVASDTSGDRIETSSKTITFFKPISRSNSLEQPVDVSGSEDVTDEYDDSVDLAELSNPIQFRGFTRNANSPLTTISEASFDSGLTRSPLR
ncbi:hypothetical protein OGAPHI_002247 [Ogataea philodendri]|uniref:Uncharacterized protein n=1 Tax=Ogataea philodendri TaxID=1378263 RepID=A0A9P8T6V1_9ASCO|nr:uncharacterized protein OGAPHI_002247 [Ogataea philodendri]KAH3668493.1 hypothetical protein OGAPHI_002247 [Ogataea philodendri]